jgi:hypothetical protein
LVFFTARFQADEIVLFIPRRRVAEWRGGFCNSRFGFSEFGSSERRSSAAAAVDPIAATGLIRLAVAAIGTGRGLWSIG